MVYDIALRDNGSNIFDIALSSGAAEVTLPHNTNSLLKKIDNLKTHSTDSLLKKLDNTLTHTTDSLLKKTDNILLL